jgi:glycosyltransferase involved in cell wall biosynthesis
MKVALVTTDFLPNIGGVTQHIVEIAKALLADGDFVEVIAPRYTSRWSDLWKAPYAETPLGIPVWRIPLVVNTSIKFITGQISSRISDQRLGRELLKRLAQLQPDVVHWHALSSRHHPLGRWSESAKVWTNHTSHFIVGIGSDRRRHYRKEAEQADEIIAPSEELCELTANLGVSREHVHFIPNGVDCHRFSPTMDTSYWRKRLGLASREHLVLCPRRLEKKNGVSYFIQAAISLLKEGVRDVKFAVAGDFVGPRSESEEDIVANLVGNSTFKDCFYILGRVENKDMPGLYASSDVVVIPSLMEATSLSAMEAMAAGKPLVSTDVGGLPFLVRDGENGFLVPPRQPSELARAIERLLDSPALRTEFGKNGRARVEKELDWRIIAKRTKEIYVAAIERHRAPEIPLAEPTLH